MAPAPLPDGSSPPSDLSWTKVVLMFVVAVISGVLIYFAGDLMERYAQRKEEEIEEELKELEDSGDVY